MNDIHKEVELTVRVQGEPSVMAMVFDVVTACGIEILACSAHSDGKCAVLLLVTDNVPKTQRVLEAAGLSYGTDSVVVVDMDDRGTSATQYGAQLRAEGIDILYSYVFVSEGRNAMAVFKTDDDNRAIDLLRGGNLHAAPESLNHFRSAMKRNDLSGLSIAEKGTRRQHA